MHITSVARLRLDTNHDTTDWNEQNRRMHDNSLLTTLPFNVDNTGCHMPPFQRSGHIFKTPEILPRWLPCFRSLYIIHTDAFTFLNMFLIPWHLRIFQNIHHHQHGDCRILADGMGIWHLEHHYHLTSVLGRRPQPDHPRCSLRMCLHPLLLDFNQPHPMPVIWRSFIWMFCSCIKFSLHPAVVLSRWRLWEWFQWGLTNTFMKNTMHTPCIQYWTCILRSCPHYVTLPSWYSLLWHTTIPTQTSALPPYVPFWQLRGWPGPRQLIRQLIRWWGRFPNGTYWWWTLDNRNGTRENILHTWRWITKQCMSIPMPLQE